MLPVLHAGPAPWTWVSGVQVPNYSSGLALQAVGVRIRRSRSVALDGILGVAMTLYALLVSDFLDTVASLLQVMVALLGQLFTVPIARAAGGTDLCLPVGLLVSAGVYLLLMRHPVRV